MTSLEDPRQTRGQQQCQRLCQEVQGEHIVWNQQRARLTRKELEGCGCLI
jgi:hypothetical protein